MSDWANKLRASTIDYDGSPIPDGAEPMDHSFNCGDFLAIADTIEAQAKEIERLWVENDFLRRENEAHRMRPAR